MTGRQLMAALIREAAGDDRILDLDVELDLDVDAEILASITPNDVAFDGNRLLLTWDLGQQ